MTRYKETVKVVRGNPLIEIVEHPNGQWVKFKDVEAAFEKILEIMEKGTPNRRHGTKVWEQKIIDLIDREIE